MNWELWRGDNHAWDDLVLTFPDQTVYQGATWAAHRAEFGWRVVRLTATQSGRLTAAAQVMVREYPLGVMLAWVPGGPLGTPSAWGAAFRRALAVAVGARRIYIRANIIRAYTEADEQEMLTAGWRRPRTKMNSGLSLEYDLSPTADERIALTNRMWRRNLRSAEKTGVPSRQWVAPDAAAMHAAYEAMQSHKKLAEQFSITELESIVRCMGTNCIVVRSEDAQGHLLALRGALISGAKAWDIFAAATPEGREVNASYSAFWMLMRLCAERGVRWYDMGGIDPVNNKGVYDFKRGAGATNLPYLGEWDWSSSSLLWRTADFLIARRQRGN